MISTRKNFLFIHVPKTGGNSVQNVLKSYSEDRVVNVAQHHDGVEEFEIRNDRYELKKHSTLTHYRNILLPSLYRSLYKVATIRNPWDRMISFYFSPHRGVAEWDRGRFIEMMLQEVMPLQFYVTLPSAVATLARRLGIDIDTFALGRDMDFFIRFEHLDEDFKAVCQKLDIPWTPLTRRNRSKRKHYSAYYDDETRELVAKRYRGEVEYGGYEFERG